MDLLFRNPRYFYDTYFGIPWWLLICLFAVLSLFLLWLRRRLYKEPNWVPVVLLGGYLSILITVTLLGQNRVGVRELDPFVFLYLKQMFLDRDVHVLRGFMANMLLFLPYVPLFQFSFPLKNRRRWLLYGILTSAAIELLQFIFAVGHTQLWDLFVNTVSVFLGYLISLLIRDASSKEWNRPLPRK